MLAHVAGEDVLREIFASGEDVHAATAAGIIGADPDAITPAERSKAKMVNYGIAYGLSAFGLADRLNIERDEAATYIERYFERFPAVKTFIDATIAERRGARLRAHADGPPPQHPRAALRQPPDGAALGERLAVNTVIQGTAADIIKVAMVSCHRAVADAGLETELVLQIHDELLFEGPGGGDGRGGRDRRAARWSTPSSSTRRSRSTSASGPTGWRRSSAPATARSAAAGVVLLVAAARPAAVGLQRLRLLDLGHVLAAPRPRRVPVRIGRVPAARPGRAAAGPGRVGVGARRSTRAGAR